MATMLKARVVHLEGVDLPCLLLTPHGEVPEELVVDFGEQGHQKLPHRGPTTFRLEPSSAEEPEPSYRELFDE